MVLFDPPTVLHFICVFVLFFKNMVTLICWFLRELALCVVSQQGQISCQIWYWVSFKCSANAQLRLDFIVYASRG